MTVGPPGFNYLTPNKANTLGVGVNDGYIIRKAPTGPVARRLVAPTQMKLKGLNLSYDDANVASIKAYYSTWPWTTWIKPQIDLANGLGANALRWFALSAVLTSGTLTQAQMFADIDQFLDYTDSLGLYVYPLITDVYTDDYSNPATIPNAVAIAAHMASRQNIIGLDMGNEINTLGGNINTVANLETFLATLRPQLLEVCPFPLSTGLSTGNLNQAFGNDRNTWTCYQYCDFMDFHCYWGATGATPVDFNTWRSEPIYKPYITGEGGATGTQGAAAKLTMWTNMGAVSGLSDCMGALGYCVQDGPAPPGNYGIYTDTGTGPDTNESGPFASWPAHA